MIEYRPFRNCDPPAIQEIWASQPPCRGVLQPMTPAVFDQLVLSKPYFDRHGLLIATDAGHPVGLVHAGFSPTADRMALDMRRGIVCLLMVSPLAQQAEIALQLLQRSEDYLRRQGACEAYGGCYQGANPFYLGLYGGCGSPGILTSDTVALQTFSTAGYEINQRRSVFQRDLVGFRAPVDRHLVELKRKLLLDLGPAPLPANWWDACAFAHIERLHGSVAPRGSSSPWGSADFWDIEPLASSWGVHAIGLLELTLHNSASALDPPTLATYLLAESLRAVQTQGVTRAEVHTQDQDQQLSDICRRLGFNEVAQGVSFRKEISSENFGGR